LKRIAFGLIVAAAAGLGLTVGVIDASASSPQAVSFHVVGTWPDDTGYGSGGWVLWSNGYVKAFDGAGSYGNGLKYHLNNFVGMIGDPHDNGYWLITSTGRSYAFGAVCNGNPLQAEDGHPRFNVVGGIFPTGNSEEGFSMITLKGRVYRFVCPPLGD
jgi:hypothetical protein